MEISRQPLRTAQDVYDDLGEMLRMATTSPGFSGGLSTVEETVRLEMTEPPATITLRLVSGAPLRVELGETSTVPTLVVSGRAEAVRLLLRGELNPVLALDGSELAFSGDPTALMLALPQISNAIGPLYRLLIESGDGPSYGVDAALLSETPVIIDKADPRELSERDQ